MSNSKCMISAVSIQHEDSELTMVNARDLHKALNIGRSHAHWIEERKARFGLVDGVDFVQYDGGGDVKNWRRVFLSPLAALRIALAERSFRGVETSTKRALRRQTALLKDALLEARPDLDRALRHYQNNGLTGEEREQLVGGRDQWLSAVEQLSDLGFIKVSNEAEAS